MAQAPSPRQQWLDRFDREYRTTLKVMKALPAGQEGFKPAERSQTAIVLLHTFSIENSVASRAIAGKLEMPARATMPPPPATAAEAILSYERGAEELIRAVREAPEERVHAAQPFFAGPGKIADMPVMDILWFMLMDSVHHRGQLSVYVRMAGGKVPSIYGPSADEPWM